MEKIVRLLFGRTAKNSAVLVGANIAYGLLIMLFIILSSRTLGPERFGLVSIALAIFAISFDVLSLGTSQSLVRFVSVYIGKKEPGKALEFAHSIFKLRTAQAIVLIIVSPLVGWVLSEQIYQNSDLFLPITLSVAAGSFLLISDFFILLLQAYEKFGRSATTQLSIAILKLVLLAVGLLTGNVTILSITLAFIVTPLLGLIIGFALAGRIDILLMGKFASSYETGIYSVASRLNTGFILVGSSFASVLTPKISRVIHQKEELQRQILLIAKVVILLIIGIIAVALASTWFIPLIFGPVYQESVLVFQSLSLAAIFFAVSIPANVSLLALGHSKLIGLLSLLQLVIVIVLGWLLIPSMGSYGAALALIITYMISFLFSATYAVKAIFT
ncbi:MAG: oligosaccharide flippase family protein [Candidatus Chisholmbacteria bacterium]|nr:oligosaccharide flippase family protein [Candidatus Chisholmbacteria bacterium]